MLQPFTEFRGRFWWWVGSIRLIDTLHDLGHAEYQSERNLYYWATGLLTALSRVAFDVSHLANQVLVSAL